MLTINSATKQSLHINNTDFTQAVLNWFKNHGRKDLPWQHDPSAYRVWVSEVMLQQTQVKTGIPYFINFMDQFPKITDLAASSEDQLMALWSGLGFYNRARNLHKTAQIIVSESHRSSFPETLDELQALPGIGRSTAGAILSLAMGKKATILDGNVKRVLSRCFKVSGWTGTTKVAQQLWQIAEYLTPETRVKDYTQAMMDLGATICTSRAPDCTVCPLTQLCLARQEGSQLAYPEKKKKKTLPIKQQYFYFLISNKGELLMEKRPPSGIWGSLWTPISCDLNNDGEQYLRSNYGIELSDPIELAEFRHTFSHFHLQFHPVIAEISQFRLVSENNLRWNTIEQWLNEGIPAAVRKILLQLLPVKHPRKQR